MIRTSSWMHHAAVGGGLKAVPRRRGRDLEGCQEKRVNWTGGLGQRQDRSAGSGAAGHRSAGYRWTGGAKGASNSERPAIASPDFQHGPEASAIAALRGRRGSATPKRQRAGGNPHRHFHASAGERQLEPAGTGATAENSAGSAKRCPTSGYIRPRVRSHVVGERGVP